MVSFGKNTNSSQFYITLAPLPWLNGSQVVFGKNFVRCHHTSSSDHHRPASLHTHTTGEVADQTSMETVQKIEALGSSDGKPRVKKIKIYESIVQDNEYIL